MKKTIQELEAERLEWSLQTFPEATAESSMLKLMGEAKEVIEEVNFKFIAWDSLKEEYADCLMCLFDSAGRMGISPDEIFDAFAKKLEKNKARKWGKPDSNGVVNHVK